MSINADSYSRKTNDNSVEMQPLNNTSKYQVNFEEALKMCGGFGKMQWFVCLTLIPAYVSGGFIVYGLSFLEKYPTY